MPSAKRRLKTQVLAWASRGVGGRDGHGRDSGCGCTPSQVQRKGLPGAQASNLTSVIFSTQLLAPDLCGAKKLQGHRERTNGKLNKEQQPQTASKEGRES